MSRTTKSRLSKWETIANSPTIQNSYRAYSENYDRIAKNNSMEIKKFPNPNTGDYSFLAAREAHKNAGITSNLGREIARTAQSSTRTEARRIYRAAEKQGYGGLKVTEIQNAPRSEVFQNYFNQRKNEILNNPELLKSLDKRTNERIKQFERERGRLPTERETQRIRDKSLNDLARPTAAAITSG